MSSQCNNIEMSVLADSPPYQVLSQDEISIEIDSAVIKTQAYLKISTEECLILLLKFKWDIDSLKETYDAFNDPQNFLIENHIVPRETVAMDSLECSICCFEGKLISLACGHQACEDCWKQYLEGKIQDGEVLLECMDPSCKLLSCMVDNEELEASYKNLVIDSYVEGCSDMTWCNKECGMAIKRLKLSDTAPVECSCGTVFCFSCGRESHLPATCRQMQLWEQKCVTMPPPGKSDSSDSTTQEWLLTHTKNCPRCSTPIEKIGGCRQMRCSNRKCRFMFCWNCHGSWLTHGYNCDKAKLAANQSRVNKEVTSKLFHLYFEKMEEQKRKFEQEKALQQSSKVLLESRQTLIHSFVFGFFLKRGYYFDGFEKLRKRSEQRTNNLAKVLKECSENPESKKIVEKAARNCQATRRAFLEYCSTGSSYEDLDGKGHTTLLQLKPQRDGAIGCRAMISCWAIGTLTLVLCFVLFFWDLFIEFLILLH
ncbi:hypothetical protein CAEBREN_08550 [Caenorhabditis brenneri]|uniref:RBR-type E3 ubiquitin transferase n=1 Tax=Caenorhabditis brenneri TaxID=135651 RepID=G0MMJ4_CAEBE|nr:hypothetical protein CAEBREN_08550 [Caenorhabditis brenneri]